jgi:hypothetical protein
LRAELEIRRVTTPPSYRLTLPSSNTMKPRTQTALVGGETGQVIFSNEAAVAKTVDDIVLIRNKASAVNPVDTKMTGPFVTPGSIAGSDFAGVVEYVGPDAIKHNIKPGDRVCGVLLGMNPLEPRYVTYLDINASCIHTANLDAVSKELLKTKIKPRWIGR